MSSNDSFIEQACPVCHGRKFTQQTNLLAATQKMMPCDKCFGRGTIQIKPDDLNGITVMNQIASIYWFSDYVNGNVVSSLLTFQCPIMINGLPGKKFVGNDLAGRPTYTYRIFTQIVNMYTKPKHRREGRMKKLVEFAMSDPKIEWAETQWDTSSDYGRNLLLGMGFFQEDNRLVYRKVNGVSVNDGLRDIYKCIDCRHSGNDLSGPGTVFACCHPDEDLKEKLCGDRLGRGIINQDNINSIPEKCPLKHVGR